jgi:hypothetical protein
MNSRSWMAAALGVALLLAESASRAQTPDQQRLWEAERVQRAAAEQAQSERLARERAARKADPMGWVRTLDPMTSGGWEFRSVAGDGAFAIFGSTHQFKRSGSKVTVWLREEFAEPQSGDGGRYLSLVEQAQFDCRKSQTRDLLVIYYAGNNLQGTPTSEEGDPKETPWSAIVPGTREEVLSQWACARSA